MGDAILHSDLLGFDLTSIASMPDQQAADALTGRIRSLETIYRQGFVERGLILLEVQNRNLWQFVINPLYQEPYTSFTEWVCGEAPMSRRDCFAALAAVKELKDVPLEDLKQISRDNVTVMQRELSSSVRTKPDVIEDAKLLPEAQFRAKIAEKYPDQHIEHKAKVTLRLTESAKTVLDEAVECAKMVCEVTTVEDAVEAMAADFLAQYREQWEQRNELA